MTTEQSDLTAWRAELVDRAAGIEAELGRIRVALEVLAGGELDRRADELAGPV